MRMKDRSHKIRLALRIIYLYAAKLEVFDEHFQSSNHIPFTLRRQLVQGDEYNSHSSRHPVQPKLSSGALRREIYPMARECQCRIARGRIFSNNALEPWDTLKCIKREYEKDGYAGLWIFGRGRSMGTTSPSKKCLLEATKD